MAEVTFDFSNDIVLVSGSSRGIGREIVRQFTDAGAIVVSVDRDRDGLQATADMVPGIAMSAHADISNAHEVEALFSRIDQEFGRIDICVNNAGVAPHQGLLEYDEAVWNTVFSVNSRGTFLMTQAAARLMVRSGVQGRIINFSSAAAIKGGQGSGSYAPSRAATEAFGRVAAIELAQYGILVNTVRPGLIDTQPKPLPPRMKSALEKRIPTLPLRRAGTPAEVAGVVLFLASGLSGYMTGSVVTVDGGASVGTFVSGEVVDDDPRYEWITTSS